MVLLVGTLKHPESFERKVPQVPHIFIIVGRIGSDICYCRHDGGLFGPRQQFDLIELCLQVSCDVARRTLRWDV
jgi:hypothetical protein